MTTYSPIDRPSRDSECPTYTHPKGAACLLCGSVRSKKDDFEDRPWCVNRYRCDERISGR